MDGPNSHDPIDEELAPRDGLIAASKEGVPSRL